MHEILDSVEDLFLALHSARGGPIPGAKSDYAIHWIWCISDNVQAVSGHSFGSFRWILHDSCIGQGFGAPKGSEICRNHDFGDLGSIWHDLEL